MRKCGADELIMVITKEQIEARKKALLSSIEKKQADVNAMLGALQDCEYWLTQLNQPDQPEQGNHEPG